MDEGILKQNMDADGKQSIHVTPNEAALVRRLEGGRDAASQSGYEFMRTLDYSYDPQNPPKGMTEEERRSIYDSGIMAVDGGRMDLNGETFENGAPVWQYTDTRTEPDPMESSLRPTARPPLSQLQAAERAAFYEAQDEMVADNWSSRGQRDNNLEWAWNDIQTLVPTSDRMATPEMFLSNPMSTSGLAYVDANMDVTKDMRGNKTPEHLQRQQDDIVSYLTSEMSRNMIEDLRMSMPRRMQDSLEGSLFVEAGRDGTHSLFTGDDATGYTELSFGPDDEGFRTAMDTVRRGLAYSEETGDFDMDAGFWGRATSANDYDSYNDRDLTELVQQAMREVRLYHQYEPFLAAEAMTVADQISDEQRRRRKTDEARKLGYSRRVVNREIGRRAKRMMGQGRL